MTTTFPKPTEHPGASAVCSKDLLKTDVRERPILFSGQMVRAILSGRKTQTRRIIRVCDDPITRSDVDAERRQKGIPTDAQNVRMGYGYLKCDAPKGSITVSARVPCPYGQIGDRLWVKETFRLSESNDCACYEPCGCKVGVPIYRATANMEEKTDPPWKPSIFMPRYLSRITLEIEMVRAERLQDIGKDGRIAKDVLAEGITESQIEQWRKWLHPDDAPAHTYGVLWDSINGKTHPWKTNPWVWVVTFKQVFNQRFPLRFTLAQTAPAT